MPLSAVRRIANWVNLSTPLGLTIARLGRAQVRQDHEVLYWAEGYRFRFPVAGAFTVGNVIITASYFEELGPAVWAHEVRHTWQWMLCGSSFLPLYIAAMGWSWALTGDRAAQNPFERIAGLGAGGYHDQPLRRPVAKALQRLREVVRH